MTIKKCRELPIRVRKLMALKRRLLPNHSKIPAIDSEISRRMAGYNGEKSLDYYLNQWPFPESEYLVFNDLRLPHKDSYFQIDTLILFSCFYLILEVKNMNGMLEFDPAFQQLIQTNLKNNQEIKDYYPCPITQVQNQQVKFEAWLSKNKIPLVTGECQVVITNNKSFIRAISNPKLVGNYVIRNTVLTHRMDALIMRNKKKLWTPKDHRKITSTLLKQNEPVKYNPIEQFDILPEEIQKGVFCPQCEGMKVEKRRARWECSQCNFISLDAYLTSLEDYYLLFKSTITISELQEFFQLNYLSTARNILQSLQLEHFGNTSQRQYILPFFD
ncbi:nuclease-related domain-containing protein [Sutcliffiella halmapala]|uniref:nuclease-related domain-containing protein n=1 Tax=Sutcliffiella halmapala TaxID=79882 RepID=UPI000994FD81|nr:nuclease-related domain-containing protein [Sutcliffiella halmapala]